MSNYNKNAVWGNKTPINQSNAIQPQLGVLGNLSHSGIVPFQQQQVFQNIGLNQQNLGLGLQQMAATQLNASLASNPIFQQQLSAAVSYPNPRGLNPTAFQTSSVNSNLQGTGTKERVFTGTVTQIHDNFGFIDDEVFFPRNAVVKGSSPMVGDKVLVEAAFNSSMPFKWNAMRVQALQGDQQSRDSRGEGRDRSGGYNAVPPPSDNGNGFGRRGDIARDLGRDRSKPSVGDRRVRSRDRDDDEIERKRRREERAREREKDEKDRKSPVRRRSRSPKARRRTRIVPRYMVQIPKIALDLTQADVLEVKRRYNNLYIPSDFFNTYVRWVDAFPPNKPYTLNKPCSFHIMYKELDSVDENDAVLEPSDADYRFSAKVMLMSVPGIEEIYQKCCAMAEDKDKRDRDSEEKDFVHPTRLINFLVGLRGKNETMAIGGPWSPSLDGENPEKDPAVLIKTAIRTCKALTGIDLSNCTKWYRFLELYYRRSESTHKGKLVPARVETVILFLPDVWSCLPTRLEWEGLQQNYRKHLEKILKANSCNSSGEEKDDASGSDEKDEDAAEKLKPTHHSQLDPKALVVADLRNELKARNLVSTGLKSQLVARLTKALKTEAEKDDEDEVEIIEVEEDGKDKDKKSEPAEEKKLDEQQKRRLEKHYTLPDQPHLIVHPSKTAKSGKFDCTSMSLSLLLDYRPEDTKEHSFEVSLFAELFNEMLMRDFGFNIFKALYELPEKPKEKEDDKKKKDEKKDDKKSDEKKKDKKDDEKKEEKSAEKDRKYQESDTKKDRDDEKKKDKDKRDEKKSDSSEDEDEDDDKKDKKDKKKKDRVKLYTKNKHLLLSFVYFDTTHCGYIFDKDIEELLYTLGLNLSRSQVKKLVSKIIARDSLHYRKLTDKPKEEDKDKIENGEKAIDWNEMSMDNKRLLPIFECDKFPSKSTKKGDGESSSGKDGLVIYQGAVVDIDKLLSQLERSEKARIETEQHMVDLKTENHKISEKYAKSSSTIKHLTSEVKDYKEKLRSTEDTLGRTNAHAKLFQTTLMDIRDKIEPILKTASHKDKEDRKDRDRDGDKKKDKDDSKSRWEKERDSSKKESDKEKDVKKDQDVKKEPKDKENKEELKKEKDSGKKEVKKKEVDIKNDKEDNETESQGSEDAEMKEEADD